MDFPLHHFSIKERTASVADSGAPNGAGLLVECLYRRGVRDIFGMPGSHSTYIYDAIERHGGIQTILCRNEQAGAFMADGYARATGRPGVICTTAGPGATNALSGIAEAFSDSVPVLLIAGQVNHDRIDQECGRYHEVDLEGIFRPCVRFAGTLMTNEQIPAMVDRAFEAMISGRPGPAALMFPQDLMGLPADANAHTAPVTLNRAELDSAAIAQATEAILASRRPIVLAGGGAVSSDAGAQIEELARRLGCPVVTTVNGKGILDERAFMSLGHGRTRRGRMAISRSDLMIAVGCRFTEVFTASGTIPIPRRIVQIDIDPSQIGANYPVEVAITGDAQTVLNAIISGVPYHETEWKQTWRRVRHAEELKPEWLIDTLRAEIPEASIIFTDACEMGLRMQTGFHAYAPRTFFGPANYLSLGWGYPAAIGGSVGQPDRWTLCVSGDGGFLMTAQELATAARYNLKVIAIVHNDSAYGAIKAIQKNKHEARYVDTDLNNPDFVKFGESFGVPSRRARNAEEFAAALQRAIQVDGPSLIEIPAEWRSLRI
jgi:acetolactate synthase I/II/III large subunit